MEGFFSGHGVSCLCLDICTGVAIRIVHRPHRHIGFLKAWILHIVDIQHFDTCCNCSTVLRCSFHRVLSRHIGINCSHLILIPGNRHPVRDGRIIVNGTDRLRHNKRFLNSGFNLHLAVSQNLWLTGRPVVHIFEHIQRRQFMPFKIKECLIIPRASAIIFAGIQRIIHLGETARPSASMFLPDLGIALIVASHRNPCALPVENAKRSCLGGVCNDIPDAGSLSLHGYRIILQCIFRRHTVTEIISILTRVQITGFQNAGFFSVLLLDFCKHGGHVIHGSMPVRIIRNSKNVVIHIIILQSLRFV